MGPLWRSRPLRCLNTGEIKGKLMGYLKKVSDYVSVLGFSSTACQCFSHATDCFYDPEVEKNRASLDTFGRYDGGGVCINCQV